MARNVISVLALFSALSGAIPSSPHWVDIWTAMPQLTESANLPPVPFNSTPSIFPNTTLRQTLRLTQPASTIRLRLSNAFGTTDLPITNVSIALPPNNTLGISSILPSTITPLSFDGEPSILIPPGSLAVSDPINLPQETNTTLSIDLYLATGQTGEDITSHPGSRTTSWMTFGEQVGNENLTGTDLASVEHWYFLSAIEALLPAPYHSCAILGDSITDGRGSDTDENNRWPDLLLPILHHNPTLNKISLLNQAAGGNRILHDGLGPNLLSRIDRDVLAHSAVTHAIVFEGVNDIGTASNDTTTQQMTGDRIIRAYRQIITRLHAAGIKVFGATITPFGTPANATVVQPYSDPERERTRQRVNGWIRGGDRDAGGFDGVVDFDAMVRSESDPGVLRSEFDSGDHLHLNPRGYEAMARGFPVGLFE
ncbi:SGNH/GDSL hydrolase family protein [Aspergillus ibericus CBS 121593]|uniref:SGNH hydrolase n=1 Tax=Aspergillus ibericus CBS 121593 TaxID=1448316 RepID=A0A395GJP7_9EURO|nr:SGNH hydrolase [Aspergillus ibericus CBS 121593]RAK95711.1 SGNH hydrolase [Aspergillus ibericus CBS 121593]